MYSDMTYLYDIEKKYIYIFCTMIKIIHTVQFYVYHNIFIKNKSSYANIASKNNIYLSLFFLDI